MLTKIVGLYALDRHGAEHFIGTAAPHDDDPAWEARFLREDLPKMAVYRNAPIRAVWFTRGETLTTFGPPNRN